MRVIHSILFCLLLSIPTLSLGESSPFCTDNQFNKVMNLYQHRHPDTAKIVFQVLSCNGEISKKTRQMQYTGLIAGYMHENPELIDHLLGSANTAGNPDAPAIFLDGLWICASKECRSKLKDEPFNLPADNVEALLSAPPPDPFSIAITSPQKVDFLWGYYYGSGDIRMVERIHSFLCNNWSVLNSKAEKDLKKRLVVESARWSFVSVASQNKAVRNLLQKDKSQVSMEMLAQVKPQ